MSPSDRDRFLRWLEEAGPAMGENQVRQLLDFGALVLAAAPRLGLISRGDRERFLMRHVRESLWVVKLGLACASTRILDVGSGAGLPGIPIAIAVPECDVTLVEPKRKRAGFLDRCALALKLSNVRVEARTLVLVSGDRKWDTAVSRGLSWTASMADSLSHLVVESGALLRFGPRDTAVKGVRILPTGEGEPRGIQVWPRASWPELPRS